MTSNYDQPDPKPGWSVLYITPVDRLLFLCGLKISNWDTLGRKDWVIRRQPMEL